MEFITPILSNASPYAVILVILAALFFALLRGELIPRRSHERELSLYKESANTHKATVDRQAQQIDLLLETAKTTAAFFKAMPSPEDEDEEA